MERLRSAHGTTLGPVISFPETDVSERAEVTCSSISASVEYEKQQAPWSGVGRIRVPLALDATKGSVGSEQMIVSD